jgi:hypothetical protein
MRSLTVLAGLVDSPDDRLAAELGRSTYHAAGAGPDGAVTEV